MVQWRHSRAWYGVQVKKENGQSGRPWYLQMIICTNSPSPAMLMVQIEDFSLFLHCLDIVYFFRRPHCFCTQNLPRTVPALWPFPGSLLLKSSVTNSRHAHTHTQKRETRNKKKNNQNNFFEGLQVISLVHDSLPIRHTPVHRKPGSINSCATLTSKTQMHQSIEGARWHFEHVICKHSSARMTRK